MTYEGFQALKIRVQRGVAWVTIDHPRIEEADLFNHSAADPDARERMAAFLAAGGQTRELELALGTLIDRLG